jgi:formate/nitrite transporter
MRIDNVATGLTLDAHSPLEMAERMEDVGVLKATMDSWSMFALAVLAGSFIALGAEFFTLVITDSGLGFGMSKLVGGLVFCLGLVLVVVAGAELFTGNNLIVMAWVAGKLTLGQVMRNWIIVYFGNLIGSLAMVVFMYFTKQWTFSHHHVGATALNIAVAKVELPFIAAVARGILCNALVCLAVWLTLSGRSVTDKVLAVVFPITAFVASGFEHSIANMYFIPMGLLMKGEPEVIAAAGRVAGDLVHLNAHGFVNNLIAVTTGNIFGGGFLVAAVYWFIYRRPKVRAAEESGRAPDRAETPSLAALCIGLRRTTPSKRFCRPSFARPRSQIRALDLGPRRGFGHPLKRHRIYRGFSLVLSSRGPQSDPVSQSWPHSGSWSSKRSMSKQGELD